MRDLCGESQAAALTPKFSPESLLSRDGGEDGGWTWDRFGVGDVLGGILGRNFVILLYCRIQRANRLVFVTVIDCDGH